jgi:predicted GNAT family acetyltransferase
MTDPTEPTSHAPADPGEAGPHDREDILSEDQALLADEVRDGPQAPALDFTLVNDEKSGAYWAVVGDREIAGLPYEVAGDDRLVLLATSVFPEFRRRGIATELIRRVLDDVRAQGKTVTVTCPVVQTFIERNPEYGPLVDPKYPGVPKAH